MSLTSRAIPRGSRLRSPFNVSGPQIAVLLIVLAGMALAGNLLFRRFVGDGTTTEAALPTAPVQRRTIESSVNATGTVSATRQVRTSRPSPRHSPR